MGDLFCYIFDGIRDRFAHECQVISQQFPFEPLQYPRKPLRLTYAEGIKLLRTYGPEEFKDAPLDEDITTPAEKALGKVVKDKFGLFL
jgi:aspartyl-tRNA synthetase